MKHHARIISFPAPLALGLAAFSLALAGCSKGPDAALMQGDAALNGQSAGGAVQPVLSRPVKVGGGGAEADACGATAHAKAGTLAVRWSNSADGPVKAQVSGDVWSCEVDGEWTGVIFPAPGQAAEACEVASPVRDVREYQGPCRWGWVKTTDLVVTAG